MVEILWFFDEGIVKYFLYIFFIVDYQIVVYEVMDEFCKYICLKFVERIKELNWLFFVKKDG